MKFEDFLSGVRYHLGDDSMLIDELWIHFQQRYPNLTRDIFDYMLQQLNRHGEYGVNETMVYKRHVAKMAHNQNETKMEDILEKYKIPYLCQLIRINNNYERC